MDTTEALVLLQPLGFFRGLNPAILRDIAASCEPIFVPAGELIFRQGDPSDSLYIVSSGRLGVSLQVEGHAPRNIYEASRGQLVGEMGLLTGDPRSASVRSLRDSLLLRLSKERFEELTDLHPSLIRRIACDLSERIKQSNARPVHPALALKTFAVFPAGQAAPTDRFAGELIRALAEIGTTRLITKATVVEAIGGGDLYDSRVVHWLNEQESKFDFLLYQADALPSRWTSRCIRQADRLLAVAPFDGGKEFNQIEIQLANIAESSPNGHPRMDLILLHRGREAPSGTTEWLAGRSVNQHYHLWDENPKEFKRLARALTGRAVGLVLGGGGARGFAHIGAIRAIEEAGISIQTIGGTSQGALIAAQYALGQTPAEMLETNRALFQDFRPFKGDFTLPFFSFMSGRRSNKGFQSLFGNTQIADLRIPFFCVSNNLSLAAVIVHNRGLLWRAVRCSMALPGLMPPVVSKGHLIIDGGVLNNLPVDVMRDHCNGPIIAVDVSPPVDLLADCEDRDHFGWIDFLRLKRLARKKGGSIPHLMEILMRTAFLSSIRNRQAMASQADLCVHPPMDGCGLLDWDNLEELAETGYQATREMLKHWDSPATLEYKAPAGLAHGR